MTISIIFLCLVIVVLLVNSHYQQDKFRIERKDLMDRLMSKDFVEYKEHTGDPVIYEPVALSEEQEYWREIEENKV